MQRPAVYDRVAQVRAPKRALAAGALGPTAFLLQWTSACAQEAATPEVHQVQGNVAHQEYFQVVKVSDDRKAPVSMALLVVVLR